jgi:DNA-binding transcriptional ArsR family regulator
MPLPLTALAEPNRLRIVELLRDGPRPVSEIAERLRLSQPLVSKHLGVLKRARLVRMRPDAQRRIYLLEAARFQEMASWLETFRRLWEGRLDTLDEYLQGMKAGQARGKKKDPRRTRR